MYKAYDDPYGSDLQTQFDSAMTEIMSLSSPIPTNWTRDMSNDREAVRRYWDTYKWIRSNISRDNQRPAYIMQDVSYDIEGEHAEDVLGNIEGHCVQLVQSPAGYHLMITRLLTNDGSAFVSDNPDYDGTIWRNPKTQEVAPWVWVNCAITQPREEFEYRKLLTKLTASYYALKAQAQKEAVLFDVPMSREEASLEELGLGFLISDKHELEPTEEGYVQPKETIRNTRNNVPESMSEEHNIDHPVNEEWREKWTTSDDEILDSLDF